MAAATSTATASTSPPTPRGGARASPWARRAIRPGDIQRELIKIAYFDPVSIALLTGDTGKLDRNRHCKHVPMTKQG